MVFRVQSSSFGFTTLFSHLLWRIFFLANKTVRFEISVSWNFVHLILKLQLIEGFCDVQKYYVLIVFYQYNLLNSFFLILASSFSVNPFRFSLSFMSFCFHFIKESFSGQCTHNTPIAFQGNRSEFIRVEASENSPKNPLLAQIQSNSLTFLHVASSRNTQVLWN